MRFWWVNHKQTFDHEVGKGYIWCPKRKKDESRNHFYETLREVQRGDLVFSFANAHLQAVGVSKLPCYSCPRPDEFGKVGEAWDQRGWRVDVAFRKFFRPLRISTVAPLIAPLLPSRYSPIQPNGHGNQGAYLSEISRDLAKRLIELADPMLLGLIDPSVVKEDGDSAIADPVILIEWEDALQASIASNDSISETTRNALIQARRGQGKFKENVARFERECRITHVGNPTHLIASHIKPWRESTNSERLNPQNGLLLHATLDALFDVGLISFDESGVMLISSKLDAKARRQLGITPSSKLSKPSCPTTAAFLDYHRRKIYADALM